jgi:hypothetical protein
VPNQTPEARKLGDEVIPSYHNQNQITLKDLTQKDFKEKSDSHQPYHTTVINSGRLELTDLLGKVGSHQSTATIRLPQMPRDLRNTAISYNVITEANPDLSPVVLPRG